MGVALSTEARRPKQLKLVQSSCQKFLLSDVLEARQRFADIYKRESGPSTLIGRRQFHDVFTDYNLANVHKGHFLNLPLDMFNLFEQDGTGIADVREIFCVLALFCKQASVSAKLELVFPLFGKAMTEERVHQFLCAAQRGLARIGIIETKAPAAAVQAMAGKICGEGAWRRCSTVSAQLLGDWLTNCEELAPIVVRILSSKEHKAIEQHSMLFDRSEIRSVTSVMKREAKKLLMASQSAPAVHNKAGKGAKGDAGKRRKSLSGPKPNANDAEKFDESLITDMSVESLAKLQECWEKHKTSRKGLTKEQFADVMRVQFPNVTSPAIISRMFIVFDKDKNGIVSYDEFMFGVTQMASSCLEEKIRFLFQVASCKSERDGVKAGAVAGGGRRGSLSGAEADGRRGSLSAAPASAAGQNNELGTTLDSDTVRGTSEPVMKLIDLIKLVQDNNQEMVEAAQYVEILITIMDYDKNGSVDRDEFSRACSEMPSILNSFDECLKPSAELEKATQELAETFRPLTVQSISKAWVELTSSQRAKFKRVSWNSFLDFIDPIWAGNGASSPKKNFSHFGPLSLMPRKPTPKNGDGPDPVDDIVYQLLMRVFKSAWPMPDPKTGTEEIDLRKLICGMISSLDGSTGSQALCVSTSSSSDPDYKEKKSLLYFELFDADCSGEVDYQEFFEMLYASQIDMQDEAWKAVESLRSLDVDGDGLITFNEFTQVVRQDAEILHCFGRIFHASTDQEEDRVQPREQEQEQEQEQEYGQKHEREQEQEQEQEQPANNNKPCLEIPALDNTSSSSLHALDQHSARSNGSRGNNNRSSSNISNDADKEPRSIDLSPRLLISASAPELPLNSLYRTSYYFKTSTTKKSTQIVPKTRIEASPPLSLPSPKAALGSPKAALGSPSQMRKPSSRLDPL